MLMDTISKSVCISHTRRLLLIYSFFGIDGPNVGYFGHGNVHYSQVQKMVAKLEAMNERPLVIMPVKYTKSQFKASTGLQVLKERELNVLNE